MSLQPKSYEEALERARKARKPISPSRRWKTSPKRPSALKRTVLMPKRDPLLADWGRKVRKRDSNRCQWGWGTFKQCATGDNRIDPHHIHPRSQRPDLKYDVANGICLCRTHHDWVGDNPVDARALGLLGSETYEAARK